MKRTEKPKNEDLTVKSKATLNESETENITRLVAIAQDLAHFEDVKVILDYIEEILYYANNGEAHEL